MSDRDDVAQISAKRRRLAVSEAIRVARGLASVEDFAAACGVSPETFLEWQASGDVTLAEANVIERAGGKLEGTLAIAGGYVGEDALRLVATSPLGPSVFYDEVLASVSFDRLDDVINAIRGADAMGLHIRMGTQEVILDPGEDQETIWEWHIQLLKDSPTQTTLV